MVETITFPKLSRKCLTTLQINMGYKCNQRCAHCHVNAGPERLEMMDSSTIALIPHVLTNYNIDILDLTGGAPELHPQFKELVIAAKELNIEIIDRCNLTILNEPGHEDLAQFLSEKKVTVTASLPCYEKSNVDKQRGIGVFDRSIDGLRKLNRQGYGKNDKSLILNLVFNPQGTQLPPPQESLEDIYKKELHNRYGITFNNLYTIVNMPIKRFALQLKSTGQLEDYQQLLKKKYNSSNLENVMCRTLISVDWQGFLYDCDFNQQLGMGIAGKAQHLKDLVKQSPELRGQSIKIGQHCYGCTAGNGSSCSGALEKSSEY